MTMQTDAFWKRTLGIFKAAPVKIALSSGTEIVGDVFFIGDEHCTITKADGTHSRVVYARIASCVEAARL
jgi:hypothetical protein